MQRFAVFVLALFCGFATVNQAHANVVDDAVDSLKQTPVYVAPDIEDSSSQTNQELSSLLNEGDNIAIVMLPQEAGDPTEIAKDIQKALGGKRILAVSVGQEFAVSSSTHLSNEEARDLMHRASRIAANPIETMSAFVRNVHDWQIKHPEPQPERKSKSSQSDGSINIFLPMILIGLVCGAVGARVLFGRNRQSSRDPFEDSPEDVRKLLQEIASFARRISDGNMRMLVERVCVDVNEYYKRNATTGQADLKVFPDLLGEVKEVIDRYVVIQTDVANNRGYYYTPHDPKQLLNSGYESVEDFAERVAQSISNGMTKALEDFTLKVEILKVHRNSEYMN